MLEPSNVGAEHDIFATKSTAPIWAAGVTRQGMTTFNKYLDNPTVRITLFVGGIDEKAMGVRDCHGLAEEMNRRIVVTESSLMLSSSSLLQVTPSISFDRSNSEHWKKVWTLWPGKPSKVRLVWTKMHIYIYTYTSIWKHLPWLDDVEG